MTIPDALAGRLKQRVENASLRSLKNVRGLLDFSSNDYLGFARSPELKAMVAAALAGEAGSATGSTGSRLLTGNSERAEALERFLAGYHGAGAALLFNSGYDANLGLLSCVPQRGDTVLYDALCHASLRDGIRLSRANAHAFAHNDLAALEKKLARAKGNVYVAVESVYSMAGDFSPLPEIAALCAGRGTRLIVDEAHAGGLFGEGGRGRVAEAGLAEHCFARVHTFGKALGCHGAAVLGSGELRNYLINFSRPFIYSTALPPHSILSVECAYGLLGRSGAAMDTVLQRTALFRSETKKTGCLRLLESESPIQCIIIPGNARVKAFAAALQRAGYDVRPVLSPTVPAGAERLRICLHAFNAEEDVRGLAEVVSLCITDP